MICSRKMVVSLLLAILLLTVQAAAFKGGNEQRENKLQSAFIFKTNPGSRDGDASFRKKPLRRGGCSAFGHSCFGGHGKRSDDFLAQLQSRRLQRIPPADIVRQWMKSLHSATPLLE